MVWEKPNLGAIEYNGSKQNNIVLDFNQLKDDKGAALAGPFETMVILDPVAKPEARFKAVATMYFTNLKKAGMYIHTSPDGIHWKLSDERVFPFWPDTMNQAFYDSRLKKNVAYIRTWAPTQGLEGWASGVKSLREVGRVEMDDITKPWPFKKLDEPNYLWGKGRMPTPSYEVPVVMRCDEHDPRATDVYNPACVQYPWADNAYFMFPSFYRHFQEPPLGKYSNDGLLDIQMAVSRDGVKWTRLSRDPYVPLGIQGDVDCCQVYMGTGMLRHGSKIFQYYGAYPLSHGVPKHSASAVCRLEQRPEGFVSADAAYEGGKFTTPPLVFSGKKLFLNINAGAMGACKVEILDEQGKVLPGYSLAECDEISGNHIEKTVSWKAKSDLSPLAGRVVLLRFEMRACKLFAFQFP